MGRGWWGREQRYGVPMVERGDRADAETLGKCDDSGVLSCVDVLLDRLDELQSTGRLVVGQQALAPLGGMPDEDLADLDVRAEQRRVTKILAAVRTLADGITSGRREPPDTAEMHEIARAALRAEYAPRSSRERSSISWRPGKTR